MKKLNILVIIVCLLILTGCENNNTAKPSYSGTSVPSGQSSSSENQQALSPAKISSNIESIGAITEKNKLIVFLKNNNSFPVDIDTEVEFYDDNNMLVGSDTDRAYSIGANSEAVVEMWSTPDRFSSYKIYTDAEVSSYISYLDKVEISHNNTGKEIVVQVKNNTNEDIEHIEVAVVFYLNDKVVGYGYDTEYDIKAGRNANFEISYPYNTSYKKVLWDTYKVYLNEAYSYNW